MFCETCGTSMGAELSRCEACGATAFELDGSDLVAIEPAPTVPVPASPQGEPPSGDADLTERTMRGIVNQMGVLAIRHVSDGDWGVAEGLRFPVPLPQADTILTEPLDGDFKSLNCRGLSLRQPGEKRSLVRVRDVRARVLVTESRLTVACSRYEKGGGWWGTGSGALLAIPLNVGSRALAAQRRRGKMLVAQVRYPWVAGVYAQNRDGYRGAEVVRVIVNTGGKGRLHLQITLPNDLDAVAVAAELIRRAARFRLECDPEPLAERERERLVGLAGLGSLNYVKGSGSMAGEGFPSSWPVSERSARFGLTATEVLA